MSLVQELHEARKDRLARIAAAAARTKPALVVVQPIAAPVMPRDIFNPQEERAWMMEMEGFVPEPSYPTLDEIFAAVCTHYGIGKTEMMSQRRKGPTSGARHVVYYLARRLTLNSLQTIGRKLGDRDHTTILHGVRRIEERIRKDEELSATVEMLVEKLGGEK